MMNLTEELIKDIIAYVCEPWYLLIEILKLILNLGRNVYEKYS